MDSAELSKSLAVRRLYLSVGLGALAIMLALALAFAVQGYPSGSESPVRTLVGILSPAFALILSLAVGQAYFRRRAEDSDSNDLKVVREQIRRLIVTFPSLARRDAGSVAVRERS